MEENKKQILIIDDEPASIQLLSDILNQYDITASTDGSIGIQLAWEGDIDLILLDIMMPFQDGFEISKLLKSDPKTSKIPIIFITGKHDTDTIQKAFELGAVDYIAKPYCADELQARIKTHLQLASYHKGLEKKVQDALEQNLIQERLLHQSAKQAALGELLMHIAHQWKQPLSEIGSINVLNLGKLTSKEPLDIHSLKNSFKKIDQILKFMSNTVETFEDFYRPKDKIEFIDLHTIIQESLNIIDATLSFYDIKVHINKHSNPKVYVNPNEISQVLLNIISNAKDALLSSDIKYPKIIINIDTLDDKGVITIQDNANEISEERIKDLFTPFSSTKNSTGIGLYMAKTILQKYEGSIVYDSSNKHFKITL
jgi:DNA-binding response OmpR family regulator